MWSGVSRWVWSNFAGVVVVLYTLAILARLVFTPLTPLYTYLLKHPSLTLSHPHTLTPSLPHTLTPSPPHTLTPSHPHPLTPSHPHSKKQEDARQLRHISQLKKETRKKENKIQSLEADAQRKAIIMKRRADEVIITSSNNIRCIQL